MMQEFKLPVNAGYLPTYDGCYGCGQKHNRGLRIRFFTDGTGKVHAYFTPERSQTGYDDVVHGGVISTLLDEQMGWPIALQTGCFSMTAELTVRFIRSMHADEPYLTTAFPGIEEKRFWTGSGEIRDMNGRVCAKAQGKYYLLTKEQTIEFTQHMTYQPGDLPFPALNSSSE